MDRQVDRYLVTHGKKDRVRKVKQRGCKEGRGRIGGAEGMVQLNVSNDTSQRVIERVSDRASQRITDSVRVSERGS